MKLEISLIIFTSCSGFTVTAEIFIPQTFPHFVPLEKEMFFKYVAEKPKQERHES